MIQYLISAYDFTDENALERRTAARTAHLEGAKDLKASNNFIKAGAFLNDKGQMIGSAMMMQFESKEKLNEWLANEPYVVQKVWDKIEVKEIKIANI